MATATIERGWTAADLEARVVRYRDLKPCLNAFIDTRTPGSAEKENFTIIGPGVSENPDQHVHIAEAHGFNIGGARQPPDCTNSQHSHDTAEVFVVHSGQWRFDFGEQGDDAQLMPVPATWSAFRSTPFAASAMSVMRPASCGRCWAATIPAASLGRRGCSRWQRITASCCWRNGALIDTAAGQTIPADVAPMPVTSRETIAALRVMKAEDEAEVLARAPAIARPGEELVIGAGGTLPPADGFTLSRLTLDRDGATVEISRAGAEVVFVQDGAVEVVTPDARLSLGRGDTMTVPAGLPRAYASDGPATLFVVRSA